MHTWHALPHEQLECNSLHTGLVLQCDGAQCRVWRLFGWILLSLGLVVGHANIVLARLILPGCIVSALAVHIGLCVHGGKYGDRLCDTMLCGILLPFRLVVGLASTMPGRFLLPGRLGGTCCMCGRN